MLGIGPLQRKVCIKHLLNYYCYYCGPGSSVGIATDDGLEGSG